jgi:molybdopterin-dependent oxidoreductase alpha subunit
VYGFIPPQHHGFDTVNAIHAMLNGRAKVFMAMGGNFLSATPDTNLTAQALRNCSLTVHVSTKLNRSHLVHGKEALILPCLGRSDQDIINGEPQFVSCENSMGVVQMSKGNLKPVSKELLSEPVILCRLAQHLLGNRSRVNWALYMRHYDHIRNDIEKVIPGFDRYNERVRRPGGFYLPNTAREGRFNPQGSGKAHFNLANITPLSLAADEYIMMTIRSHDQFNTTIYGLDDRYRGVYNERRVIYMNEKDIARAGLQAGDVVNLVNKEDGHTRIAHRFIVVPYSIPERCTATYFPETNVLVPLNSVADKSNTPVSKMVVIHIVKHEAGSKK